MLDRILALSRRVAITCLAFVASYAAFAAGLPGLWQKSYSGANITTGDPEVGGDIVTGALFASTNVNGAATMYYTDGGKSYEMGANTTYAYKGVMTMQAGKTYCFAKNFDDNGYVKIIDRTKDPYVTNTVISSTTWNETKYGSFTPTSTDWYGIELRVGNGSGGNGPTTAPFRSNLNAGLVWNSEGIDTCTTGNFNQWHRFMNGEQDGIFLYTDIPGDPVYGNGGTVSCNGTAITLTTVMTDGKGDLTYVVKETSGTEHTLHLGFTEHADTNIVARLTGLATGKTYSVGIRSYSEEYGTTAYVSFGDVYLGNVSVAKVADAYTETMTDGSFRISRPTDAEATHSDLTVYYTLSGATAGTHYEEIPLSVTIPAGESEVTIPVTPIWTGKNDQTLTLKLTSLLTYLVGTATASIYIKGSDTSALTRFVSTTGSDSNNGMTEATAFLTIDKALDDLKSLENTTIRVAPGTYTPPNALDSFALNWSHYEITNSVTIVGTGDKPEDVHIQGKRDITVGGKSYKCRDFFVNNSKAKLKNMLISNGATAYGDHGNGNSAIGGGGVYLYDNGGTVEDCVISNCACGGWNTGGGGVRMMAGRVLRTKFTRNTSDNDRDYTDSGAALCMHGGYAENCLITQSGNGTGGSNGFGPVAMGEDSVMSSCTIAGNHGKEHAGIYLKGSKCRVYNSAIFYNDVTSDGTGHATVYYLNSSASVNQFVNCIAERELNSTCTLAADGGFANQAVYDFHLGVSSPLRDTGNDAYYVEPMVTSATDLDGVPRTVGSVKRGDNLDVGCYEFDVTKLSVDFYVDNTIGLMEESGGSLQPYAAHFHIVKNGGEGTATYSWDFDADGVIDLVTTDTEATWNYADIGTYTVKLYATDDTGNASAQHDNYISTAPHILYVDSASTNPKAPYITRATAALYVDDAYGWALDGSKILVAPRTYKRKANTQLTIGKAVTIWGEGDTAADTVFTNNLGTSSVGSCFNMSNSGALLANITFVDGYDKQNDDGGGAGISLAAGGGIVSNCVFKHCGSTYNGGGARGGGAAIYGGLVTHCVFDDCYYNMPASQRNCTDLHAGPNDCRAQGAMLTGNGKIENCLLKNMHSDGDIIRTENVNASVRNCTIADCSVSFYTGNEIGLIGTAPRARYLASAIDIGFHTGYIYNTAVVNVTRPELPYYTDITQDSSGNYHWITNTAPATNSNWMIGGQWSPVYYTIKDTYKRFQACATEDPTPINDTCFTLKTTDFVNYGSQDFTPKVDGILYNTAQTVSGWDEITDLAGKPRYVGKGMDIGCYEQQYGGIVYTNLYVDCNTGDDANPGTMAEPKKTIANACAEAKIAGGEVYVRGGPDRTYTFSTSDDTAVMTPGRLKLVGCDQDWEPATGYLDADSMATLVIADDYATKSFAAAGSKTTWTAPIVVKGGNATISGFRCEFGGKSFKEQGKGGSGLIEVSGNGLTVENCYFKMSVDDSGLGFYQGACSSGLISAPSGSSALTLRNCYVWLGKYRASLSVFQGFGNNTKVQQCLFENIDTLYGELDLDVNKQARYNIISNIFLNCDNGSKDVGYQTQLLGAGGLYCPAGGEIAYNRFIHNDGKSGHYVLMQHGSDVNNNGTWSHESYDTLIHHNTIVGYDVAFEAPFCTASGSNKNGSMWKPFIFDNLIIASTNLVEEAIDQWSLNSTKFNSSFKKNSKFWNNALMYDVWAGGSATSFSWFNTTLIGESDTTSLDAVPSFVDTTNPQGENYYRLKIPSSPWVVNAYVGEYPEYPDYPKYIGAVEPQPGGFAVRIR